MAAYTPLVLSLRKPVMVLWVAALLVAAVMPVAVWFLAPLVLLGVIVEPGAPVVLRNLTRNMSRPAVVAVLLAPHRPRAALPPALS